MRRSNKPATTNSGQRVASPNSTEWTSPPVTKKKVNRHATPKGKKRV